MCSLPNNSQGKGINLVCIMCVNRLQTTPCVDLTMCEFMVQQYGLILGLCCPPVVFLLHAQTSFICALIKHHYLH